jgi:uncharacterized protein (DUF1330 family)
MPKGYWISLSRVDDPAKLQAYRSLNGAVLKRFGANILVAGGASALKEGVAKPRQVLVEFDSYATALACYESPDYQQARALRAGAGEWDFVIVEGV